MEGAGTTWHGVDGYDRVRYRSADWTNDLDLIRGLFEDYRRWISDHGDIGDASVPRVKAGLAALEGLSQSLPGGYGPPRGDVLLWYEGEALVACGALREQEPDTGELKRIYIRADYRGGEFGKPFVRTLIARGRELGYRRLRAYALGSMASALEFYEELGFRRTDAYWPHPAQDTVFFQLVIDV